MFMGLESTVVRDHLDRGGARVLFFVSCGKLIFIFVVTVLPFVFMLIQLRGRL